MVGIARVGLAAALLCPLAAGTAKAQASAQETGIVRWRFDIEETNSSRRAYRPLERVILRLVVTNETARPLAVDEEVLRQVFSIGVNSAPVVPRASSWLSEVLVEYGEKPRRTFTAEPVVVLDPRQAARWRIALDNPEGGPFQEGEYRLLVALKGFGRALREQDGTPWRGRVFASEVTVQERFSVKVPKTPSEIVEGHLFDAGEASLEHDWERALRAYESASIAEGSSRRFLGRMGPVLLNLKRYRDAVGVYEALIAENGAGERTVTDLATAYLGAGDEGNARRVLRQGGRSEAMVDEEVLKIRDRLDK